MGCAIKTAVVQTQKKWCASIQGCDIRPILWFSERTYMDVLSAISIIYAPYFAAGLVLPCATGRYSMCWCLRTIKSTPRRFSPSPELMLNLSIVPETGKSACDRFFCTQTPTDGIAPSYITKYSTACAIWELNSCYCVFFTQSRARAKHMSK